MKKCPDEFFLLTYAYGELSGSKKILFEKHAGECPDCRGKLESLKNLRTTVRQNLPAQSPSEETISAINEIACMVMEEINSKPGAPFGRLWYGLGALAAAAAVLMVFFRISALDERITAPAAGYETSISLVRQQIENMNVEIEKNRGGKDAYETSLAEIRQKIDSLYLEIGEDI